MSEAQQAENSSRFDQIAINEEEINTSRDAVRAAVVAVAKDMEFIGKGGFLMPDVQELIKFVRNCVPHIVRGEYIDSYFMNQEHGKNFWKLRGKGFKADEATLEEAISEIVPIYESIVSNIADVKNGDTPGTTANETKTAPVAHAVMAHITSQDIAVYTKFNQLAELFGIDAIDIIAECKEGDASDPTRAKKLSITYVETSITHRFELLKAQCGFEEDDYEYPAIYGSDTRDILVQLNAALETMMLTEDDPSLNMGLQ